MDNLAYYLTILSENIEIQFMIKIIISLMAGYMIGKERSSRGKDAGITTFTFVIIGAMLFTFLSEHIDPLSTSRIAAQIVSGIGFLGAGLIFINNNNVKNLTTAAGIWLAGAIGMAIGFDYYGIALITTIVARYVPNGADNLVKRRTPTPKKTSLTSQDNQSDDILG